HSRFAPNAERIRFDLGCSRSTHQDSSFYSRPDQIPSQDFAELYVARIVCLHGVPKTITSDRGPQFVARFWEQLQESLGTKLIHSSAYHPQTSGQVERVNQVLEDMLRACVITFAKSWDECLPLAEFSYNNSYQKSLQ